MQFFVPAAGADVGLEALDIEKLCHCHCHSQDKCSRHHQAVGLPADQLTGKSKSGGYCWSITFGQTKVVPPIIVLRKPLS